MLRRTWQEDEEPEGQQGPEQETETEKAQAQRRDRRQEQAELRQLALALESAQREADALGAAVHSLPRRGNAGTGTTLRPGCVCGGSALGVAAAAATADRLQSLASRLAATEQRYSALRALYLTLINTAPSLGADLPTSLDSPPFAASAR